MLDELRAMDWMPRMVRSRTRQLNEATQAIKARLGRQPDDRELAARMRMPLPKFRKFCRTARPMKLVSLNHAEFQTDSNKDLCLIDILEDCRSEGPLEKMERKDLRDLLLHELGRTSRIIVILYYFEGLTMKEISRILDLSESRVSQRHAAILDHLRNRLQSPPPWTQD